MDPLLTPPAATLAPGPGVVWAVLNEVARLLALLARDPLFSEAIDLQSLPLGEPERDRLRQQLGRGEVEVRLDLAGPSEVSETAYAGVWWLRHADGQDHTVAEQIVVARVPELLLAHPLDIGEAARRLADDVAAASRQETAHG